MDSLHHLGSRIGRSMTCPDDSPQRRYRTGLVATRLFEPLIASLVLNELAMRFSVNCLHHVSPPACNFIYMIGAKDLC